MIPVAIIAFVFGAGSGQPITSKSVFKIASNIKAINAASRGERVRDQTPGGTTTATNVITPYGSMTFESSSNGGWGCSAGPGALGFSVSQQVMETTTFELSDVFGMKDEGSQ